MDHTKECIIVMLKAQELFNLAGCAKAICLVGTFDTLKGFAVLDYLVENGFLRKIEVPGCGYGIYIAGVRLDA